MGATRDISAHGVFICTQQMATARAVIEVDVAVGSSEAKGTIARLKGVGEVLRINTMYGKSVGFAAAIKLAVSDMRISSNP